MAEPDALIADVLRALREDRPYHHGLPRLWLAFRNDQPRLNRAVMRAHTEITRHRKVCEAVGEFLEDRNHLKLGRLDDGDELAVLEAIDEYLWLHYDAMGNAPPARIRLDGEDWLIHRRRIVASQHSRHAAQTGHLQTWCRFHWVLPATFAGFRVTRVAAPDTLASAIAALLAVGHLRIAIASFSDGVVPAWETHEPPMLRALMLTDEARRWAGIEKTLQSALQAEAHALVLPELR